MDGIVTAVLLHLLFGIVMGSRLPRIALASTGVLVPEANTSSTDAIQTHGPGIDLGVEHLQRTYGGIFNFSHTYLMEPSRPTVTLLLDDVQDFAAKFFYQNADADGISFLSSCTVEQNKILSFTKATESLLGCSTGSVPVSSIESNENCFSLSLYPGSVAMQFIYALLMKHGWTNLAALVDLPNVPAEPLSRGFRALFQERFNGLDPSFQFIRYSEVVYSSKQGYSEIERALRTIAETSRVIFLFGSGKSFLMALRTAAKLGMTNGEYVFFMLSFNRLGPSLDKLDDAWWKVTDDKDESPIANRGYVSAATIVISFRLPYSDGIDTPGIRDLRSRIVAIARRNYNMNYPRGLLNETYAQTGRILNGLEFGTALRKKTFRLPTGVSSFSARGERDLDMIGEIVDPRTGNYVHSLLYNPESGEISDTWDIKTIWPGGHWPPPNEPLCGYLGSRCSNDNEGYILQTQLPAGVAAAIILLTIIWLSGKWIRDQQRQQILWWLLDHSLLVTKGGNRRGRSLLFALGAFAASFCIYPRGKMNSSETNSYAASIRKL
ncbi:hypothetical protein BV898_11438 [Hypsibius exemplaris]|uniref:Receptor ligand binding region domain-containing protein n=1 Tax=Hypsibius exemplaris TaxID=2072580 RepID=A0A1W0WGI9_HYPEX|nr:hypothetical protein BV898_11438 [Hypsibius exemplaris]